MKNIKIAFIVCYLASLGCAHDSWTKTDTGLAVTSILATGFDTYTTERMLDNSQNYEMNPMMGRHPSDSRVIVTMGLTQVAVIGLAYFLPVKYRRALLTSKIIFNTGLAVHNLRLD